MPKLLSVAAVVAAAVLALVAVAHARHANDQYIVLLQRDVDVDKHLAALGLHLSPSNEQHPKEPRLRFVYRHALHGYTVRCSDAFLLEIRRRGDEVVRIEPDSFLTLDDGRRHHTSGSDNSGSTTDSDIGVVDEDEPRSSDKTIAAVGIRHRRFSANKRRGIQHNPPSWGLDRIDQPFLPLDAVFYYPDVAGQGVDVYSIDAGVDVAHVDFGGRAMWGKTIVDGGVDRDLNGHGTATAALAAGTAFGVAKLANVIAVKVFNDLGFGATSDVIAGIDYVIATAASRGNPAVALLSVGGSKSEVLDRAVAGAFSAGVVVTAAAGGSSSNACQYSPGGAPESLTVASSDDSDTFASNSNSGSCVKIVAPGVTITTARNGGGNVTMSSSSMGAGHVAGAAAVVRSMYPNYTPLEVETFLINASTKDVLRNVPEGTPNRLLFVVPQ